MKKRRYKRKKVNWYQIILDENLVDDFKTWCSGKKTMSKRKLYYMFVKHIKGSDFCSKVCRVYTDIVPDVDPVPEKEPVVEIESEEVTEDDIREFEDLKAKITAMNPQKGIYGL